MATITTTTRQSNRHITSINSTGEVVNIGIGADSVNFSSIDSSYRLTEIAGTSSMECGATVDLDIFYSLLAGVNVSTDLQSMVVAVQDMEDTAIFGDLVAAVFDIVAQSGVQFSTLTQQDITKLAIIADIVNASDSAQPSAVLNAALVAAVMLSDEASHLNIADGADTALFSDAMVEWATKFMALADGVDVSAGLAGSRVCSVVVSSSVEYDAALSVQQILNVAMADGVEFHAALVFEGEVYDAWVVNTETSAPSFYTNHNFNSMFSLGGRYFGANEDGLYEMDGSSDGGSGIIASIKTGMVDFGGPHMKNARAAYLGMTSTGRVLLKTISTQYGEPKERWYELKGKTAGSEWEKRIVLGRGVHSKYWQFEIVDIGGLGVELDTIDFEVLKLSRRIGHI